jgi:hypothetical protein
VAGNRTYNVQARVPYIGDLLFPAGIDSQVALLSDTVMDLNVPDPGDLFVISGRVTDASGSGLNKVEVTAVSHSLARTPQPSFRAIALTDANGAYRLTVPAGTYQLIFTPQIPAP